MSSKCTNNHNYSNYFEDMKIICKSSPISNCLCEVCEDKNNENNKKISDIFYYCSNCFKFFCLKHGESHNLLENHNIFFMKKFVEHDGTTVIGYCSNHNKNYCLKCIHMKITKKFEELNDEQIQNYEKEMKKNEEIFQEIETLNK